MYLSRFSHSSISWDITIQNEGENKHYMKNSKAPIPSKTLMVKWKKNEPIKITENWLNQMMTLIHPMRKN